MVSPMNAKSSAHYQREYRRRLRERGLVKKEVWIHPDNGKSLSALERELREPPQNTGAVGVSMVRPPLWSTTGLFEALSRESLFSSGEASLELIEGVEPSLHILMHEYGDLPLLLTVAGEQIVVEALLWPQASVTDVSAFNDAILRSHKFFPLSTIGLDNFAGRPFYCMFGALSANSIIANIVFEIETLAANVIQAADAYEEFVNDEMEA